MRKIICCALFSTIASLAQINGNKKIETRSFNIENLTTVKIDLNASILIDASLKEGMTITTDSNLFEYIAKENKEGILHLNQLKWIQPSNRMLIKIGAPNLKYIEQDTHGTVKIINLNSKYFQAVAAIGEIIMEGTTEKLYLKVKNGTVNAEKLIATNATVISNGRGEVNIHVTSELFTDLKEGTRLQLTGKPQITGNYKENFKEFDKRSIDKIVWIPLKIKNNSWKWNSFEVVGPKRDGRKFSYGFTLLPGATKKEKWSTGTKVYKVDKHGDQELLVTITLEDKDGTVKLFGK